jgi:RNA polymerase subunit RPABC4/transcription elongation factor Spt4
MEQLIENCTSETNTGEDWEGIILVCEKAKYFVAQIVEVKLEKQFKFSLIAYNTRT